MENSMSLKHWLSVIGLTCAAFIFNTSEFIPIGLLSDIAGDFGITEAHAGMLISVYAWIVMLLSLPLMIFVSRMEMRKLLLFVILIFTGFQVLSSVSTGYYMLMFSRIGVACTHAIFWSIVSPIAVRIVPEGCRSVALSMIVTGTSVAMIFGLPLGRVIGLSIGWRMTFLCAGVFSFLTVVYLFFVLPKVPSRGRFSLHKLPALLKQPLLKGFYILSFMVATSYYTGYSYIEPFLKQVGGIADGRITMILMVFGGAGILGSLSFSRYYSRNPYRFLNAVICGIAACLLLMRLSAFTSLSAFFLCAVWGISVTAFNVALQAEIIEESPQDATAVSMSVFSGIFNFGIACGTLVGGAVCTYASISYIGYAGGLLAIIGLFYWRKRVLKLFRKPVVR